MGALIFESDAGSIDEVFDGVRHENLSSVRLRRDPCGDVDRDPTDVVTPPHTLTGMQTATNIEADVRHALGNRGGAQNGPRGAVEGRQHPITGVL